MTANQNKKPSLPKFKFLHITDIHLNFLEKGDRLEYYQDLNAMNPTHIFLTGDIGEAQGGYHNSPPDTCAILEEMTAHVEAHIYFVLGNHDYYHGTVDEVRDKTTELAANHPRLTYLPSWGIIELDKDTYLLGVDGWADGRAGDYENSLVIMNDSNFIHELWDARRHGKSELVQQMNVLSDRDTVMLDDQLENLLWQFNVEPKNVIILTHVPPFEEVAMFRGERSTPEFLPFYVNWGLGQTLLAIAKASPHVQFHVLCGHSHCEAHFVHPEATNLQVTCGAAEYSAPAFKEYVIATPEKV